MEPNHTNTPLGAGDMETRLWEYIDGLSDGAEKSAVEKLIAENREWEAKYNELLEVHRALNLMDQEEPSLRFTKNVMEQIAHLQIAPATKAYINQKIIWGIAAFFITVIVGFLIYGVAQVDWSRGRSDESLVGIDFTRIDYGRVFNNSFVNMFMMLNVVLGLMLLDRYLSNKKKRYLNEAG